jgi:actin-like ATPase involved in cell morphogenesis
VEKEKKVGMIIGIDLGTTYSAVAIPEQRSGEGFFSLREFPGYSVILDSRKRRITPSVVAEDDSGKIVVGLEAKGRAGMSPEPIMFAKRWMGEDKTFVLAKQGTLRPAEVSTHVLRYLKQLAESRLGVPVDEAVITVPAYFSARAKQMTQEAAEKAGLRVAQLAQEPVAAAIMYCANDKRDPLRVMTYDLGGGTFDIAILEKLDGTISSKSILAFDGDRFLGGYDFDKIVAQWILDQLIANGYDLHLDMTEPRDREIFAKLMVMAERVKIDLSSRDFAEIREQNTGIKDHRGEGVTVELDLTREQFEGMIERQVNYTIELCRRAMTEKANPAIDPGKLHEILMVGGSSRIPMIGRRLREEFGREPRLVEPDLCVALGAAVIAGACVSTKGCLRMGRIPAETDLTEIEISGQVVAEAGLDKVDGCGVTLRALDGSYRATRTVRGDGAFQFPRVGLAEGETTDFSLTVTTTAGTEAGAQRFSVRQTAAPSGAGLIEIAPNVLSKPIGVMWLEGLEVIAPERTPLPFETTIKAVTSDASGRIRASIVEGNTPLGEIVMTGLPPSLGVGSEVKVTVNIANDFKIHVRAWITSLAREGKAVIDIPARPMKSVKELRGEFNALQARAQDALNAAGPNKLFGDAKASRLEDRQADCRRMLDEGGNADVAKIQDCMDEIDGLIRDIGQGWKPEPPKAVFDHAVTGAHDLHARAKKAQPEIERDGYDKQIEAIRAEGGKAYTAQNPAAWKESYEKLVGVCDKLAAMAEKGKGGGTEQPKQDPVVLMMQLSKELEALEKSAKASGKYVKFQDDFIDLAAKLKAIDTKSPDAMSEIRDWYFTGFQRLKVALEKPDADGTLTRGAVSVK